MVKGDYQLKRASFDFDTQTTTWEVMDHAGVDWAISANGIVRIQNVRKESLPVLDERNNLSGQIETIYVASREDILANSPVFKRVA